MVALALGSSLQLPRPRPSPLRPGPQAPPPPNPFRPAPAARQEAMGAATVGGVAAPQPRFPIEVGSIKAVLFDVDGTLANSDPLHLLVFQDMLQEVGFNGGERIDEDFFRRHISGRHNPDIMLDLFPDWPEEKRTEFYMSKEARYRAVAREGGLDCVAGLPRFLEWVATRGYRRAAVTNAPRENAEVMLEGLGIADFFEILVIGAECERAKPHPDPYQEAMRALGVTPEESFALEDSPSGLRAAVAAGLPTVGLTTGQPAEKLEDAGAAITVADFDELMGVPPFSSP